MKKYEFKEKLIINHNSVKYQLLITHIFKLWIKPCNNINLEMNLIQKNINNKNKCIISIIYIIL